MAMVKNTFRKDCADPIQQALLKARQRSMRVGYKPESQKTLDAGWGWGLCLKGTWCFCFPGCRFVFSFFVCSIDHRAPLSKASHRI